MSTIAIIEDDPAVNDLFTQWIKDARPQDRVLQFFDRDSAEQGIAENNFDLVILDIELGWDKNAGIGIINTINCHHQCPVLVVSGLSADVYRPIMRELKAWDFLIKPIDDANKGFFLSLVRDSIRTGKTSNATPQDKINNKFGDPDLTLDPLSHTMVLWKGKRITLSITDQRIVNHLVKHANDIVSFNDIYKYVPAGRNKTNIRAHIHVIRESFKDVDTEFDKIQNIPMIGYMWRTTK